MGLVDHDDEAGDFNHLEYNDQLEEDDDDSSVLLADDHDVNDVDNHDDAAVKHVIDVIDDFNHVKYVNHVNDHDDAAVKHVIDVIDDHDDPAVKHVIDVIDDAAVNDVPATAATAAVEFSDDHGSGHLEHDDVLGTADHLNDGSLWAADGADDHTTTLDGDRAIGRS